MIAVVALGLILHSIGTVKAVGGLFQFDFKGDFYIAGRAIIHGQNPYPLRALEAQAVAVRSGHAVDVFVASPRYPPPVLLAALPLSLLPFGLAGVLSMLLCAVAMFLGLRLLGVSDWRCIGLACLSAPALFGYWLGNLSVPLFLGVAVVWRWRSRLWMLAVAVASVIVAKVFLWPLGVWLLVTRRFRALAIAILVAAVGTFVAWAVIGFAGMTSYPQFLSNVADVGEKRNGVSLVTVLLSVGFSVGTARALAAACTAVLLGLAWRLARHEDGDRRAFGLVVMAALTASPVVWLHYLVLLFVPIALLSPRLSPIWFLPMLASFSPGRDLPLELIVIGWLCSPLLREAIDRLDPRFRLAQPALPDIGRRPTPDRDQPG